MIRRALEGFLLVIAVIVLNFLIIHLAPGNYVDYLAATTGAGSASQSALLIRQFGLNQPLQNQLAYYIWNVLHGNLGYSYAYGLPVTTVIFANLPATVLLVSTASAISAVIGILLGVASSARKGGLMDSTTGILALAGYAIPTFWLGQMALILFAFDIPLFPSSGIVTIGARQTPLQNFLDVTHHLILPAIVLAAYQTALIVRMTRTKMTETFRKDFITTARAKGLTERQIFFRHALPNSINPVITVIGMNFGFMMAGAILTETVFSWPGIGLLLYNSMLARDYPVVLGILLLISISVVVATLITDILYIYLDPRIRLGKSKSGA